MIISKIFPYFLSIIIPFLFLSSRIPPLLPPHSINSKYIDHIFIKYISHYIWVFINTALKYFTKFSDNFYTKGTLLKQIKHTEILFLIIYYKYKKINYI